ncbi:hypothetical protein JVU11DRAFT_6549 [Chiua virens]|nr:hypothetical protein JVU11DRAFT_6549 [Chiua virens]
MASPPRHYNADVSAVPPPYDVSFNFDTTDFNAMFTMDMDPSSPSAANYLTGLMGIPGSGSAPSSSAPPTGTTFSPCPPSESTFDLSMPASTPFASMPFMSTAFTSVPPASTPFIATQLATTSAASMPFSAAQLTSTSESIASTSTPLSTSTPFTATTQFATASTLSASTPSASAPPASVPPIPIPLPSTLTPSESMAIGTLPLKSPHPSLLRASRSRTPAPLSFRGGALCLVPVSHTSAKGKGKGRMLPDLDVDSGLIFSDDEPANSCRPPLLPSHHRGTGVKSDSYLSSGPPGVKSTPPTSIGETRPGESSGSARRRKHAPAPLDVNQKLVKEANELIAKGTQLLQERHQRESSQSRRLTHYQHKAAEREHEALMAKLDAEKAQRQQEFELKMAELQLQTLQCQVELAKRGNPSPPGIPRGAARLDDDGRHHGHEHMNFSPSA